MEDKQSPGCDSSDQLHPGMLQLPVRDVCRPAFPALVDGRLVPPMQSAAEDRKQQLALAE